ncbi:hypothetical protein TSOC_012316 [Tetrabaena socialis]|uniref:ATPase AAA-type core domain-containing protein n=1 Tax=Tetrabaena socialis TaxID=47790 RepID=A0A2J7ZNB9_9CHLO|nr:hypothetical protein TSOC_012316 [Tetrabaena socialis]|eukprot:PNH01756.1 hypothetical protein TSOC_012316 [Tetrabaena socialis]
MTSVFLASQLAWSTFVLTFITSIPVRFLNLFFDYRVYRSNVDRELTERVLVEVLALRRIIRYGQEVYDGRMVPHLLFARGRVGPCMVATTLGGVGMDGDMELEVKVWHLRWKAPLVPDPVKKTVVRDGNTLDQLMLSNGCVRLVTQAVCDRDAFPPTLFADVSNVARAMHDLVIRKQYGSVFVLHGHPGVGKSTAVRVLANMLDATLFAGYNPTSTTAHRIGHNLLQLIADRSDQRYLVISYDEFDISFKEIVKGFTPRNEDGVDACSKASWNDLFDTLKRSPKVVLVMSTNEPRDVIMSMSDPSRSMLREGRVDAHFEWQVGGAPIQRAPVSCLSCLTPPPKEVVDGEDSWVDTEDSWET